MYTETSHVPDVEETISVPPAFGAVCPVPPARPRDKKRVGPAVFVRAW